MDDKFTILLVDDISTNLFALRLLLEDNFEDVNILEALSVRDAIKEIMKNKVDMILTDLQMPEASGFDLARYLKDIEETKDIPIMMITGIYNDAMYEKMAYESSKNVVDYITKPIDDEILCSKLKVFINVFNAMKQNKIKLEQSEIELLRNRKITKMLDNIEEHFDNRVKIDKEEVYEYLINDEDMISLDNIIDYAKHKED